MNCTQNLEVGKKEQTSWHKMLRECINNIFQAVSNGQTENVFHTLNNFLWKNQGLGNEFTDTEL